MYECDFFTRRKVTRFYHINSVSPVISVSRLRKLRDVLNQILEEELLAERVRPATLQEQLKLEEFRHRQELRRIVRESQDKDGT